VFESLQYGDFSTFQDGGRSHLGFLLFLFVKVGTVKSAELRNYAKFYRNRSNRGRDIAIFAFFKMAAADVLDFKIFKFLTVGHARKVELLHCAKFRLNRANPGQQMAIFYYSRWRPPSSFLKYQFLTIVTAKNC